MLKTDPQRKSEVEPKKLIKKDGDYILIFFVKTLFWNCCKGTTNFAENYSIKPMLELKRSFKAWFTKITENVTKCQIGGQFYLAAIIYLKWMYH